MNAVMTDRAWFDSEGWMLADEELRDALRERGVDEAVAIEWRDEAADRRRTADDHADAQPPVARVPLLTTPAEYVLGALLTAGALSVDASVAVLDRVRTEGVTATTFDRERDRLIWQAIGQVVDQGGPAEFLLVEAELAKMGRLDQAGGVGYVRELANLVPATGNAHHFARRLVDQAAQHELEQAALATVQATRNGGIQPHLRERLLAALEPPLEHGPPPEAQDAGAFVFDTPTDTDEIRVWGDGDAIAWAAGEGLMLLGPDGVGKTTLGQQLALARAGLRDHVLGMHVQPDARRVLYLACDRPRQAARSMRRMVGLLDRGQLAERMTVWRGPLPVMLNEDRTILTRLCKQLDCGTVVVDSLKDAAVDIAKDEAGGRIASAFQHTIASGVELLVLHHPRKPEVGQHRPVRELSDAYGSRLIYGVMGSVVLLWGDPGDVIVELRHLKQPSDEIGPWSITHDHIRGHSTVERGTDLLDIVLRAGTDGLTAATAAALVYSKDTPNRNEIERVRARLDRLTAADRIVKFPGRSGGRGGGAAAQALYVYNGPAGALT